MTPMDEIIVQGDFAENYSYVVQDEIQSFHWENKQATLYPFVAYQWNILICVISECKDHTTATVFAFLKVVLKYLKKELTQIHYFTDGCAGQYTNKNNFINLSS